MENVYHSHKNVLRDTKRQNIAKKHMCMQNKLHAEQFSLSPVKLSRHSFFDWGFFILLFAFLPYLVLGLLALVIFLHTNLSANGITCCSTTNPIINMLNNGDAAPCPFPWLSSVKSVLALVLLDWMVHYSCRSISQSICVGWADVWKLGCSLCPSVIQGGVVVLNHLVDYISPQWMIS